MFTHPMNLKNSTFNIKAQCILPLLTLMLALLSPIGIYAQQKKDSAVIKLKEVVIQSQNSLDSRKLLPASVSIINKSALQISPKLDLLSEAEQTTPGLFITGKGIMGTGAGPLASGKITMRGLMSSSNSSTQILIDGVPMMMGLFGHPLSDAIEQSNVDRIEVLRGPSSLQYGGSALAGAINFISANPVPNTQNLIASMQWGSYGTVKRTFSGSIARDGYFIQAGYSHNATDGFRANSAFDNDDYFLRYGQNFSTHYQGILSVYRSNATTNDPGSIYDSNPTVTVTHVHRTLASYKVTNDYHNLKGGLTIYYQEGVNHFSDGWNSTDYLGGARLEEQLSPFKGNSILAGTETKWYGGKGSPVGFPTSPLNDVWIRQTEQSAFLVMQQKAGESLLFNAGLRTTHHSLFGFTTSPSVGATFTVCKNTFLRGLYSSGFRNPTIGELFYFPPANATLKPEKAGNVELGMNSKLCDDRLSLDLTLFSTKASDLILTGP
ncbi:MAG: TonB-dependent receptor, partial [Bacteroidota bacterium]|nr:TonB-dependent receptor [Bacteroidota bacterium]